MDNPLRRCLIEFLIWIPTLLGRTKLNDVWPGFGFCRNSLGMETLTTLCWRRESCRGFVVIGEMNFVGEINPVAKMNSAGEINPTGEINSAGEENSVGDFVVLEK